jgi:tRNA A-37 threonylcarbamoyl transferase component Bud32
VDTRVTELAKKALAIPQAERKGFLDRHCGRDGPLRARVEALLDSQAAASTPVQQSTRDRSTVSQADSVDGTPRIKSAQPAVVQDVLRRLAPAQTPDELGRVGGFRLLKVLGHGGMGVVFQAQDTKLKRKVAVKVMAPAVAEDKAARQRFLREARAMAAIEHEHVVTVYQVAQEGELPYLAMQWLRGESLQQHLQRHKTLPLDEVLRIGRQIAEGLAAAHACQLIHRDIKPSNIWLEDGSSSADASPASVRILDFGLARAASHDTQLTARGTVLGTPQFMSPEQARGAELDHRTDLFSLGAVLYRMATGQLPFQGKKTREVLKAVQERRPAPPHELNPALPREFSDLVLRLLAKSPEKRWQSAEAVAAALGQCAATHADGRARQTTNRGLGRWLLVLGGCSVVAFMLLLCPAAYLGYTLLGDRPRPVDAMVENTKGDAKSGAKGEPKADAKTEAKTDAKVDAKPKAPALDNATAQKIKDFFDKGSQVANPTNPNIVFDLQDGALKKSTNAGKTWITPPAVPPGPINTFVIDSVNPSRILAGTKSLMESINQGAVWIDLKPGQEVTAVACAKFQGPFVADAAFPLVTDLGAKTYIPNTIYVTNGKVLKMTRNHGLAWVPRTPQTLIPGATLSHILVDPRSRDTVYVATRGDTAPDRGRFYRSANGGQVWTDVSKGLPNVSASQLAFDEPTADLYLKTNTGVWRRRSAATDWERLTDD